jgi:hypothetical protein
MSGGLGLIDFKTHSALLNVCYVTKLLEGHDTEWTKMVVAHIRAALRRVPLKQELRVWTLKEALLLHPDIKVSSKIVLSLLKGWHQVTEQLNFEVCDYPVPSSLTIMQAYCLSLPQAEKFNLNHYNSLKLWTHSRG